VSFLQQPGDLAQTPLAALLLEALNVRATGTLEIQGGGGTHKLFLRDGVPVGAQTFVGFKPLGQYLLAKGLIDIDALNRSLLAMAEARRPQGEVLVEMGAVTREAMDQALSEQQAGYITQLAGLDGGTFRFDGQTPVPEWTRGIRISPLRLVVEALERPQANALVGAALRQIAGGRVALSAGYRQLAGAFGWSADEKRLLSRLETPSSPDAFFADPPVTPERARAVLAALLLLGSAEQVAAGATSVPETPTGMTADLVEIARSQGTPPPPAAPAPAATPARRSDPEEARRRRQRLLARAMQNMGVGPLAGGEAPPKAAGAAEATPGPSGPRQAGTTAEEELRRALDLISPRAAERDLFSRLGIPSSASRDEVKQAYLQLAKQFHPDRFLSPALSDLMPKVKELFTALNEAYEVLSDPKQRAEYQAQVAGGAGDAAAEAAHVDFEKGLACLKTKDYGRARGFLQAAARARPKPLHQATLAWCLMLDPSSPSRQLVRELLAEASKDATCDRALYVAGLLAREEGDEARADRMFRAAFKVNPKNMDAQREVRLIDSRRKLKGEERSAVKK
jgi:DnaJ-domain-containing protein 1